MTLPLHRVSSTDAATEPLARRLEQGQILVFERGLLDLPVEQDRRFLETDTGKMLALKNVSFHPHGGFLSGARGPASARARLAGVLAAHHRTVKSFLERAIPDYAARLESGKVNYRPLEEKGRTIRARSSNEKIHTDAFASGATHGARILRFFTNMNPSEPRIWKSAGVFPELFREFGRDAGIAMLGPHGLRQGPAGRLLSATLRAASRVFPPAILADTSPYDRAMRRMHDRLKDDDAFQADERRQETFSFAPFESWAVFTDTRSHAVVSGQHALVCTFHIPLSACVEPDLAPYRILERGT